MENLLRIKSTSVTPAVLFKEKESVLMMKGRSSPSGALEFYEPIITKIKSFTSPQKRIRAVFKMEYFNTSSSKCLFNLLRELSRKASTGNKVSIEWHHDEYDEDMREVGEDFSDALGLQFKYVVHS